MYVCVWSLLSASTVQTSSSSTPHKEMCWFQDAGQGRQSDIASPKNLLKHNQLHNEYNHIRILCMWSLSYWTSFAYEHTHDLSWLQAIFNETAQWHFWQCDVPTSVTLLCIVNCSCRHSLHVKLVASTTTINMYSTNMQFTLQQ